MGIFVRLLRRKREYADCVRELKKLVIDANAWGQAHGYPRFKEYPQYSDIRRVGEMLYKIGGLRMMRKAYRNVDATISYPGMSEMWWDMVGGKKDYWVG